MENNDDIEKLFKNSFESMEFKPSPKDWLSMKTKMQEEGIISKSPGNKKVIYLWSSIALFMTGLGIYFIYSTKSNSNELNSTLTQKLPSTQVEIKENKVDALSITPAPSLPENKNSKAIVEAEAKKEKSSSTIKKLNTTVNLNRAIHSYHQTIKQENESASLTADVNALDKTNGLIAFHTKDIDVTSMPSIQASTLKERMADPSIIIGNDNDKRRPIPCATMLENTKKQLLYVGPYVSIDRSFYTIKDKANLVDGQLDGSLAGETNFQYTAGAIVGMSLNSRVNIEMGIGYAQKIKLNTIINAGANTYSFNYSGTYLDIPLRAKVYVNKKFLRWYVMSGMVANINAPSESYFKDDIYGDATYTVRLMPQSVGLSAQVGTGLEWTFTDRISWYIEPSFKYALSPVVKHHTYQLPVNHFIHTMSVGTGINVKF